MLRQSIVRSFAFFFLTKFKLCTLKSIQSFLVLLWVDWALALPSLPPPPCRLPVYKTSRTIITQILTKHRGTAYRFSGGYMLTIIHRYWQYLPAAAQTGCLSRLGDRSSCSISCGRIIRRLYRTMLTCKDLMSVCDHISFTIYHFICK